MYLIFHWKNFTIIYNLYTYIHRNVIVGNIMNYVKEGWESSKNILNEIDELYSIDETIELLNTTYYYKDYFGRAKNRTMLKNNPKLYKSIYHHTKTLEDILSTQGTYKGKYNFKYRMKFLVEYDANIENLKCECGKRYNWTNYCRYCPEPKKTWVGRTHTNHTKRKQRISTLKYLNSVNGQTIPRYNINSIPLIENKAKELGITDIQHAENGGEYYIKELGYFVDGYSEERNIVIEVDEPHHFDSNDELKQDDINRQTEIENLLGCEFVRIRYND